MMGMLAPRGNPCIGLCVSEYTPILYSCYGCVQVYSIFSWTVGHEENPEDSTARLGAGGKVSHTILLPAVTSFLSK